MTNYNILAIAGRISYLRRQNGFTLDEAAQKLGIQRRSLSNIESGAKGGSIDLLVAVPPQSLLAFPQLNAITAFQG